MHAPSSANRRQWAANLFGWDYRELARRMGAPALPILDIHLHVNGARAARVYEEVSRLFGISRILTQTRLSDANEVRDVMGSRVSFMAVPNWSQADKVKAFGSDFLEHMRVWAGDYGARCVKFWAAPRLWEILGSEAPGIAPVDSPWRIKAAELAMDLGMMFMTHVADPDTWFATRYADATRFPPKAKHLEALERMVERFPRPWIAAHMGGWPESLEFLDGLLSRHANLHLDTSATKWVVRALGGHAPQSTRDFFIKWQDRILFGSDIVTLEDHMQPRTTAQPSSPMSDLATNPEEAFELYASRYWALRTMFETDYDGPSPIADPDLKMTEPAKYNDLSSPRLRGISLPESVLRKIYHENAHRVVYGWIASHNGR
jgi:predicted TIM-barrel fold metal-dependent hydrolase